MLEPGRIAPVWIEGPVSFPPPVLRGGGMAAAPSVQTGATRPGSNRPRIRVSLSCGASWVRYS